MVAGITFITRPEPIMNLQNIDLKLLVFLDALLDEKSVSRAAAKVCISQPAMSNALNKLRSLLDDPLLVRSAKGMTPTHKAMLIHAPLKSALNQLGQTFSQLETFDPANATRTFTISLTDYASSVLLPELISLVKAQAPNCCFRILDDTIGLDQLQQTGVDIAINSFGPLPDSFYEKKLWQEQYSVISRHHHPAIGKSLSLENYLALEHILFIKSGVGPGTVDVALANTEHRRKIAVQTKHFHLAPKLVQGSDMIATIPSKLALHFKKHYQIDVYEPPLPLPDFYYSMVWSSVAQHDPAVKWLRQKILEVTQAR